ncbi:hypothetical protein I302_105411 [Kwoniella bestiolae CBS 10118]|uniref:Uncharacterized protein n=1 Tax=Kwoniella bestiolae CBS 10118 TaxID=1296100 RepID=A0A1B9FT21_9TREE|nr:hypothetical protein I302_08692 [Kwoniella bestiolae CBS 10118]OCF21913.1 hypothetical protein I302_08692 [Kwoniella bestiolae CBS 10118]
MPTVYYVNGNHSSPAPSLWEWGYKGTRTEGPLSWYPFITQDNRSIKPVDEDMKIWEITDEGTKTYRESLKQLPGYITDPTGNYNSTIIGQTFWSMELAEGNRNFFGPPLTDLEGLQATINSRAASTQ